MSDSSTKEVCPECGARIRKDAAQCDLCGYALHAVDPIEDETHVTEEDESFVPQGRAASAPEAVFCNECGWRNPSGARFCSQCGSKLQDVAAARSIAPVAGVPVAGGGPGRPPRPAVSEPRNEQPPERVTRQVAIIITAGVLLVVALFLVTVLSRNINVSRSAETAANTPPAPTGTAFSEPLPPQVSERAAALEAEIGGLSGEQRFAKQRELVDLYLGASRIDRAAPEQWKIAEAQNTPEAWAYAGNLYYGWMQQVQGEAKTEAGRQAITAYERVLEQQPDNLAVRTDMATAYLGTNNPMEGVAQIKLVLEQDPNHVQANFNYGVMLSMIGRVDQAIAQFEKVRTLVPPSSEDYQLAGQAIEQLRNQAGQAQ